MNERELIYGAFIAAAVAVAVLTVLPRHKAPRAVVAETVIVKTAVKGDRIVPDEVQENDLPKTVRTVAVAPLFRPAVSNPRFEPLPEPVIAQTEFPSLPQPKIAKPKIGGDVCASHGMKREDTGKRWHCVKK
jgi:hypothetical protein